MKRITDGVYELCTIIDGDIKSVILANMNNGTVVFNNTNRGNAGTWNNIISMKTIGRESCKADNRFANEKWYHMYKKLIMGIGKSDYIALIDKMNRSLI